MKPGVPGEHCRVFLPWGAIHRVGRCGPGGVVVPVAPPCAGLAPCSHQVNLLSTSVEAWLAPLLTGCRKADSAASLLACRLPNHISTETHQNAHAPGGFPAPRWCPHPLPCTPLGVDSAGVVTSGLPGPPPPGACTGGVEKAVPRAPQLRRRGVVLLRVGGTGTEAGAAG